MRCLLLLVSTLAHADVTPRSNLQTETLLHPLDGFTAYTLRAGEVVYNQSPLTLPLPSWAFVGVTDWLTAEIDLLPLIGGFFVEPHVPVPSFNVRIRLREGGPERIALAFETMVQHLWVRRNQEESDYHRITREGTSWFNRITASIPITRDFRVHLSAGATFAESFEVASADAAMPRGKHYENTLSPDASVALDFRWKPWLSLHGTASIGTTFVFSDNQPHKRQATYGFRTAPFYRADTGVLRTMRIELAAFVMEHPDIDWGWRLYLPIMPYVYWQWQL